MPFSNPATATATATATALTNGIDFAYWPCSLNEAPAPTVPANFAYTSYTTRPAIRGNTTASPGTTVAWPILPRIGPAHGTTLDTFTITFWFAVDSAVFFTNGTLNLGSSNLQVTYRNDTSNWILTDGTTSKNLGAAMFNGSWHEVSITVTSAGVLTWTVDGVAQVGFTVATIAAINATALALRWNVFGNGAAFSYLSGVKVAWAEE